MLGLNTVLYLLHGISVSGQICGLPLAIGDISIHHQPVVARRLLRPVKRAATPSSFMAHLKLGGLAGPNCYLDPDRLLLG